MSLVHLLLTNYEEVRAHMMVLVLLLPAALRGLERRLDPGGRAGLLAASKSAP